MATNFPNSFDSYTTKIAGDTISEAHVNDLQSATVAMEQKLGSGTPSSASTNTALLGTGASTTGYAVISLANTSLISGVLPEANGGTGITAVQPVVQIVNTQTGTVATITTVLPIDVSIPQNTEGGQVMTLSITPKNTNNKLKIDVVVFASPAAEDPWGAALFQDSTANALAGGMGNSVNSVTYAPVCFTHYMTAGTTSSTTFNVRLGRNSAGNIYFNGDDSGNQIFGGILASSITITEFAQ